MTQELNIEILAEALAAGRSVRDHGPYRVDIGDEALAYRQVVIDDPVPTGRQILEAAGVRPVVEYSVFQLLVNGQLEGLRLDETTDLRTRGVEKFIVFHSDRSFRFDLDGVVFDWGTGRISGHVLKTLAKVDPATYGVWKEVRGKEDLAISDTDLADLTTEGVERFFTGIVKTTEG
ncbi:multiubiquitin domain-containing protein [Delftia tsuruhatensis]|uniref:multiubiquitin domain-containing protein n=1 Tax=Delftia tsuruhatensis TaxID=180282 RepID=UPI0030D506B3